MTGHEPPEDVDRRTMLLDEMSAAEIDEMARSEIPPVHRYSVSEIAD